MFNGLDRMLQQVAEPDNTVLDAFFPDRPVAVFDNSGHEVYFNSAAIAFLGWTDGAPPDPEGASFGRNADGTSNGRAYETAAVMAVAAPLMASAIGHPLFSAAQWYALMARGGITATTDMTYSTPYLVGYEALASVPDCPLRISLYHMSIEADANEPLSCPLPDTMIRKQGIKLWADGSPWVGTAALSYPYLDSATVRGAGIPLGPAGESAMNYSRTELDASLDRFVPAGWQMAFHVNGDVGLDVVLDAYQRALNVHGLVDTDHRWRVEHLGGARADQFPRVASLGVFASLGPFQFIYWGDLLDGELFPTEIGAEWMRFGDAVDAGVCVSFHNDGSVSPPTPLLNIQAAITRTTPSGTLHGKNQVISLDAALAAQTVDAARTVHREHEIGSIAVGQARRFRRAVDGSLPRRAGQVLRPGHGQRHLARRPADRSGRLPGRGEGHRPGRPRAPRQAGSPMSLTEPARPIAGEPARRTKPDPPPAGRSRCSAPWPPSRAPTPTSPAPHWSGSAAGWTWPAGCWRWRPASPRSPCRRR